MPSLTGLHMTVVLLTGIAAVAAAAVWRRLAARSTPVLTAPLAPPQEVEPTLGPMSSEDHWMRAASVLDTASAGAAAARKHHKAAAGHLDSADYALQQLVDELSQVMRVPAQPRADTNVHHLKVGGGAAPQAQKKKSAAAA